MGLEADIEQAKLDAAKPKKKKRSSDAGTFVFVPKNRKTRGTHFLAAPLKLPPLAVTTDVAKARRFPYRQSAAAYLKRHSAIAKKFRYIRLPAK